MSSIIDSVRSEFRHLTQAYATTLTFRGIVPELLEEMYQEMKQLQHLMGEIDQIRQTTLLGAPYTCTPSPLLPLVNQARTTIELVHQKLENARRTLVFENVSKRSRDAEGEALDGMQTTQEQSESNLVAPASKKVCTQTMTSFVFPEMRNALPRK